MKKALSIIFNIFWIIFVGIESALVSALTGAACCLTLVGIPFGIQHFKFIPLAFAPAGKVVVTRANKHPVLNFLWMIFGGFTSTLYFSLLGLFFTLTIVGYPIAVQLFKIASFCTAPFGAEIVIEGKYSSTKDTPYDKNVVATRILENPDKTIDTPIGVPTSARNYLLSFRDAKFIEAEKKFKLTRFVNTVLAILLPILAVVYVVLIATGVTETLYYKIFPGTSGDNNMLAVYVGILLLPATGRKLLTFSLPFVLAFLGEGLILSKIYTAKTAFLGKVLSPGNIQWLINCYPDDTEVKRYFYVTPEKMLKKLNVALSRGASPTPVVIDELNYAPEHEDDIGDVLYVANESTSENFADFNDGSASPDSIPAEPEETKEPTIEAVVTAQAEPEATVEPEATIEPEATVEPEAEAESVAKEAEAEPFTERETPTEEAPAEKPETEETANV